MDVFYELCKNSELQTVKIEYEQNGEVIKKYLHSKYDPIKEAKQWASSVYDEEDKVYIVYGGGLLYHIMALHDIIDSEKDKIIVFEPIQELYEKNKDIDFFKENTNIVYTNEFNENLVVALFSEHINSMHYNKISVHVFKSYDNFDGSKQFTIYNALKMFKADVYLSYNTTHVRKEWVIENFIKNYRFIKNNSIINDFKNVFEGMTAVIVSAGPSLDKNINDLIGREGDVVIFTGGRPLRALLNAGIKPHFNMSIDMMPENYELYKRYDILNADVPLISSVENQYLITQNYKGDKIFADLSGLERDLSKDWYEEDIDSLFTKGSVATLQLSVAIYMGCKKIIFIGQDLAYSDDKKHSSLASDVDNTVEESEHNLYVKGNYQDKILSRADLNYFRIAIQDYIREYAPDDCEFINATEGGAFIEGTKICTLKEALENTDTKGIDIRKKINTLLLKEQGISDYDKIDKKFSLLLEDMEAILKLSKKGLSVSNKLRAIEGYYGNNKYLEQLDKIDEKLKKYKIAYNFVVRYTVSLSISVEGKKSKSIKDILNNTKKMYEDINDITQMYIKYLKEELEIIKKLKLNN
ncbi:PF01973 family protein [Peptoanaerobacter stomatis]|uniref:PF01973 family protein n=1 Tax=Peptoanaerobacter stomatis TaxID=796937 RepID=J4VZI7_9FIRM|nr:6-hydroxymethylpterin diphosphokinase MptE-like protein [Peptoanaerobacter stomatis]EJU19571.1 PF01973 family protein [Peptoanaerobacter stomatis]NWO25357.1 motility associated factor glycosyltransferase family protein [Peptostreptococcaceae bacterium oral taxon 081]